MLSITALDLVLIYAFPIAVIIVVWLIASLWVFFLARVSGAAVRGDLEHRIRGQGGKRSGRSRRLTFGYVAASLAGDNCVQATILYRASAFLMRRRLRSAAQLVHAVSKLLTNVDISPHAQIEPGMFLYHGLGTVIGKGTHIGRDVLICQNVTTGGGPTIGDSVRLWAGAKVIGRVTVGENSEIGANGVVIADVPANVVAVGVPATRWIPKSDAPDASLDHGPGASARS